MSSMRAHFVEVDGVRTRYLRAGSGTPLLLLHGVGYSGDCFIRNIEPLAAHFTVIAPDMLGHGFTAAPPFAGIAPQVAMARHLDRMTDILGLGPAHVGGSSFGALVAALMYFNRPDRVGRLLLIGSGSVFHTGEEQEKTLRAAAANAGRALADPTLAVCRQRSAGIVFDPACIPEEMIWIQATSYAAEDRVAAYQATIEGSIAAMGDPAARVLERLERIACPVRITVGREDVRADWRRHVEGAARMPRAELAIYEQCSHMPFLEHAGRFNSETVEFLTKP